MSQKDHFYGDFCHFLSLTAPVHYSLSFYEKKQCQHHPAKLPQKKIIQKSSFEGEISL